MKNKKGQGAMEFLMNYGWAILVVLASIGALAWFGELSPANLLPQKCDFNGNIGCIEIAETNFNEQITSIKLRNDYPFTINLTDVYGKITGDGINCNLEKVIVFGESFDKCDCDCVEKDKNITEDILWSSGEVILFKFNKCNFDKMDLRYNGYVKIFVTDYYDELKITGTITGKIK